MKRKPIIMTEGRLRRIVAEAAMRVIRESGFDSDEDMTMYRDMYAPGTEDTVVDTDNEPYEHRYTDEPGAWGSGPFLDHRTHTFADGYDYCGDDDYNEMVDDYNDELADELSTKGGQMNYDWEHRYDDDEDAYPYPIDSPDRVSSHIDFVNSRRDNYERIKDRAGNKARMRWTRGDDPEDIADYDTFNYAHDWPEF
jgi:hypothetical protein